MVACRWFDARLIMVHEGRSGPDRGPARASCRTCRGVRHPATAATAGATSTARPEGGLNAYRIEVATRREAAACRAGYRVADNCSGVGAWRPT